MYAHWPLWHLTGAAHVEGLDHSTETTGCHGDNILAVGVHFSFNDELSVQHLGQLRWRSGTLNLPLFEQQSGNLAARGGGLARLAPAQLGGDEHQPLLQRMPQQFQRLQRDKRHQRDTFGHPSTAAWLWPSVPQTFGTSHPHYLGFHDQFLKSEF